MVYTFVDTGTKTNSWSLSFTTISAPNRFRKRYTVSKVFVPNCGITSSDNWLKATGGERAYMVKKSNSVSSS